MAREGLIWTFAFFGATLVLLLLSRRFSLEALRYVGWLCGLLTLLVAYFHRDPHRKLPEGEDVVISAADGKVVGIERNVPEDVYLKSRAVRICLLLSLWDVHINRVPVSGRVELIEHRSGSFWPAFTHRSSLQNEHNLVGIRAPGGKVLVKQIAGLLARRIVCRLRVGDSVVRGERFGMIRLGSRVDLFLPETVDLRVNIGDRILGGETVVGVLR